MRTGTNAAVYVRVSTEEQAQKLLPVSDQLAACRSACQEQGWRLVAEEVDEGISGSLWPRPGLGRLLEAAQAGEIDVVVTWNYYRVARDTELELMGHILRQFREAGARIYSVREPNASAIEIMVHGLAAGLQLQKIKEDVTRSMRSKASRSEYTGGRRLFGYRWVSKTERVIVPEEAATIARAFEMADPQGECRHLADISRDLDLQLQRVRRILRHPGYAGAYTYGRRTFQGASRSKTARDAPRETWVVTWGAHEPIVDRERWDRVQARLDGNAAIRPNNDGAASLPLTGLLRCGACGEPLRVCGTHHPPQGEPRYYYRCVNQACDSGLRVCVAGWTSAIVRCLLDQLRRPDVAAAIAAELRRVYDQGRRAGAWEAEVRRLERAETSLRDVIRSGDVSDTRALARDYDATVRALDRARSSLARDRRRAGQSISPAAVRARLARACTILDGFRAANEAEKSLRPILAQIVERVVVSENGESAVVQLHGGVVDDPELSSPSHVREMRGFSFPCALSTVDAA